MILVWIIIAIILWNIESELSDIKSALRDINDSMYEEEEDEEEDEEEEEEELEPNNLVEFVWEDEEWNWIYRIK